MQAPIHRDNRQKQRKYSEICDYPVEKHVFYETLRHFVGDRQLFVMRSVVYMYVSVRVGVSVRVIIVVIGWD